LNKGAGGGLSIDLALRGDLSAECATVAAPFDHAGAIAAQAFKAPHFVAIRAMLAVIALPRCGIGKICTLAVAAERASRDRREERVGHIHLVSPCLEIDYVPHCLTSSLPQTPSSRHDLRRSSQLLRADRARCPRSHAPCPRRMDRRSQLDRIWSP